MWGYKLTSGTPVSIPATIVVDGKYIETLASGVTTLGKRYFSEQAEQEIEIIEIQANDSLSALDKGSMVSDTFSDADGYLNSVDTGNTTLTYTASTYKGVGTPSAHGEPIDSNGSSSAKLGVYFTPTSDIIISGFIKKNLSTCDTTYIHSGNGTTLLAQKSHSTSSTTVYFDNPISLTGGVQYTLTGDLASGGSYTRYYGAGAVNRTNNGIVWDDGCSGFGHVGSGYYTYEQLLIGDNGFVEVDLPTITGTILQTMVIINGSATNAVYELEDASANKQSGLALAIKNNIATLATAPVKLRITTITAGTYIKTFVLALIKS